MSARTREEIENELRVHREYRDKHVANISALEAELAALPVEPVELVALWVNGEGDYRVHPRGFSNWEWLATIDGLVCKRHGIDPAAFARFITTFTFLPRLMELAFDKHGNWIPIQYAGTHIKRADLARRYHAAMNGGAV